MRRGSKIERRVKFSFHMILVVAALLVLANGPALARPQSTASNSAVAAESSTQPTNSSSRLAARVDASSTSFKWSNNPFVVPFFARPWFPAPLEELSDPSVWPSYAPQATTSNQASRGQDDGQKQKHPAEDANQPDSQFPPWALYSNQNIDPRVKPNAGLRLPSLFPNFSPIVPDFDNSLQTPRKWSLKISLADFFTDVSPRSSKFNEYRDIRDGPVAGVEAHYRDGDRYFNVVGRNLGRTDADLNFDGGLIGRYIFTFADNETPHNYMFGAKSLYSGTGTGNLTISDAIRTDIQNSTSLTQADAKLANYVDQQGQSVDLGLERKKRGGDITILSTYPWAIKVGASNESRDGERPWAGSFGFGDFVEIPWAVHYDTNEFRASAEWTKPESRIYFTAGFRASLFDNHVESQTFSNPFRVIDSGSEFGSINAGPAMGRIALYPSNQYYEPSASLVVKDLGWDSILSATFSAGFLRQNEALLPFSTNTADTVTNVAGGTFNATDPAALPRRTAEASINTQTAQVQWTARPTDHFHLNMEYRMFRLDNTTPLFVISSFVVEDQVVKTPATGSTFRSVPIGYLRNTASVEGTYEFGHDNQLGLTYTFDSWNRHDREVKYTNDNRVRVSYNTKTRKWLELKSWYEHTTRSASHYDFNIWNFLQGETDANVVFPMLRKIDEAPYNKDDVQIMATIPVGSSMSVSAHGLFGHTDYSHQTFGVLHDSHQSYGVDYSLQANDRLSFFADYGFEKFHTRMRDRTWSPGDASDPYTNAPGFFSFSNWDGVPENSYHTAGAGVDAYLIPERLHSNLTFTFSKSYGTESFTSPLGPPSVDDNAFVPAPFNNVDSATYYTINEELEYKFSKIVSLCAGYLYESWHINDYNYNGFSFVNQQPAFNFAPLQSLPSTALYMGGLLPPGYHANVGYFRLKFGI